MGVILLKALKSNYWSCYTVYLKKKVKYRRCSIVVTYDIDDASADKPILTFFFFICYGVNGSRGQRQPKNTEWQWPHQALKCESGIHIQHSHYNEDLF